MVDQKHVFSEDIESNQSLSKTPVMNFKVDDIEVVINQPTVIESCEEGKKRLASYIMYLAELSADAN